MANSVIVVGPDGPVKSAIQRRLASLPPMENKDGNDIEIGVGTEAQDLSILKYGQERKIESPCIILRDVVADVADTFWSDGLFHRVIGDSISGKSDLEYPSTLDTGCLSKTWQTQLEHWCAPMHSHLQINRY